MRWRSLRATSGRRSRRLQDAQHILPADTVDAHVCDDREGPLLHALQPVSGRLAIASARTVRFERG